MVNTLTMFYGSQESSTFEGRKNIVSSLIDTEINRRKAWNKTDSNN